jgi:TetR/AcrR family transcriptional regulator, regulator of mycofactocin system
VLGVTAGAGTPGGGPGAGKPDGTARTGRPTSTSAFELETIGLDLFTRHGFDATTIDQVAEAAGIGRRTFFRYYASKNDLVWGDFDHHLLGFHEELAGHPDLPMMAALRRSVVRFNRLPPGEERRHRQRMALILTVPALQAHSTLRYAAWRAAVERFAVERTGEPPGALLPRLLGHVALGTSVTAYEQWLAEPGSDLELLLDAAFGQLERGFSHLDRSAERGRDGRAPSG